MGLFGGGADSVMSKGGRLAGTIVGIEVGKPGEGEGEPVREYAVRLTDGRKLGVRQRLDPPDVVRLGMSVEVFVKSDDAVIGASPPFESIDTHGWKSLRRPPDDGIIDETLGLARAQRKGSSASVHITAVDRQATMFGMGSKIVGTLAVTVDGVAPYSVDMSFGAVPNYAAHLVAVGQQLPAFVDLNELDKVVIDWPAAAVREPGIGVAPQAVTRHDVHGSVTAAEMTTHAVVAGAADRLSAAVGGPASLAGGEAIDGVTFEQWLAIEVELNKSGLRSKPKQWDSVAAVHGVAPGAYASASSKWARAMIKRPDLATRYAEAMR
jgi:hypothetical protein